MKNLVAEAVADRLESVIAELCAHGLSRFAVIAGVELALQRQRERHAAEIVTGSVQH